jgi:hypothetical protein
MRENFITGCYSYKIDFVYSTEIIYNTLQLKLIYSNPETGVTQAGQAFLITRNVGQDGGYDKKLRNKMASDNAGISIGV